MKQQLERSASIAGMAPAPGAPVAHPIAPVDRARRALAQVSPYVNHRLQKIGPVGVVGLALLVFSAVIYLGTVRPLQQQVAADLQTINQASVASLNATVAPSAGTNQISEFLDSLPGREQISDVLDAVTQSADDAGVSLESGSYTFVEGSSGAPVDQYQLSYPVTGTYLQVRNFVDRALVSVPAIALEGFRIERDSIAASRIEAQIDFAVLVRAQP